MRGINQVEPFLTQRSQDSSNPISERFIPKTRALVLTRISSPRVNFITLAPHILISFFEGHCDESSQHTPMHITSRVTVKLRSHSPRGAVRVSPRWRLRPLHDLRDRPSAAHRTGHIPQTTEMERSVRVYPKEISPKPNPTQKKVAITAKDFSNSFADQTRFSSRFLIHFHILASWHTFWAEGFMYYIPLHLDKLFCFLSSWSHRPVMNEKKSDHPCCFPTAKSDGRLYHVTPTAWFNRWASKGLNKYEIHSTVFTGPVFGYFLHCIILWLCSSIHPTCPFDSDTGSRRGFARCLPAPPTASPPPHILAREFFKLGPKYSCINVLHNENVGAQFIFEMIITYNPLYQFVLVTIFRDIYFYLSCKISFAYLTSQNSSLCFLTGVNTICHLWGLNNIFFRIKANS